MRKRNVTLLFKLRKELRVLGYIFKDARTPLLPKVVMVLGIIYIFLPFDIISDVIPVFGQLDDIVILPIMMKLAIHLTPQHIVEQARRRGR